MAELTYTKNGDCLIPNLAKDGEDKAEEMPLGRYELLCQNFLQKHHHSICIVQSILRMTDYNFHRKAVEQYGRVYNLKKAVRSIREAATDVR